MITIALLSLLSAVLGDPFFPTRFSAALQNCSSLCWRHEREAIFCLPTFVVMHSYKSGSSALLEYLARHPAVMRAPEKELWENGPAAWAHFTFRGAGQHRACSHRFGLVWHPSEVDHIDFLARSVRVIMVIREPVSWSYSAYNYWCSRLHDVDCRSGLRGEQHVRSADFFRVHATQTCNGAISARPTPTCPLHSHNTSHYCAQTIDTFGRHNTLLLAWEALHSRVMRRPTMQRVAAFLGLEPFPEDVSFAEQFNVGPAIGRPVFGADSVHRRAAPLPPHIVNQLAHAFGRDALRRDLWSRCGFAARW